MKEITYKTIPVIVLITILIGAIFCQQKRSGRQIATRSVTLPIKETFDRVKEEAKTVKTNANNLSERISVLSRITMPFQIESNEMGRFVREKTGEIRQFSRGDDVEKACQMVDEMYRWVEEMENRTQDGTGSAVIKPSKAVPAESIGTWEIIYTAGPGGIKVGGGIKVDYFDCFGNRTHDFPTNRWSYMQC